MRKNLIVQGAISAVLMFGGAGIASANFFPPIPVTSNRCPQNMVVSITQAEAMANFGSVGMSQLQKNALLNPALFYYYQSINTGGYGSADVIALCLQPGYVSNVPSGIDDSAILSAYSGNGYAPGFAGMNTTGTTWMPIFKYYSATTSPYVSSGSTTVAFGVNGMTSATIANGGGSVFVNGLVSTSANSSASTSTTYSVSVNYDKFTAEAAQYGYQSVYTSTGTKTVSVTVIKLNGGQNLTVSQVITQLASMGYRPATLSELYALESSGAGNGIVGLGTNLESGYGYPYTGGTGGAGMGHSNGPFNTTTYRFAAVQN